MVRYAATCEEVGWIVGENSDVSNLYRGAIGPIPFVSCSSDILI